MNLRRATILCNTVFKRFNHYGTLSKHNEHSTGDTFHRLVFVEMSLEDLA